MAKNVKCKNCKRLKNHWCKAVLDSPDEDIERDCRHFRQITNGDWIRSMTDKELAEFLGHSSLCVSIQRESTWCEDHGSCEGCLEEWMKQKWETEDG